MIINNCYCLFMTKHRVSHCQCGFGNDIIYSFIISLETAPVNIPLRNSPEVLSKQSLLKEDCLAAIIILKWCKMAGSAFIFHFHINDPSKNLSVPIVLFLFGYFF